MITDTTNDIDNDPLSDALTAAEIAQSATTLVTETSDAAEDDSTTYALSDGETFLGEISSADDVDVISFEIEKGYAYYIKVSGGGEDGISYPELAYYDTYYDLQAESEDIGYTEALIVKANGNGTGYIHVSAGDAGDNDTGIYTVELIKDIGQTVETVGAMYLDQPITSSIDYAHDEDWFRVELEGGYSYVFDLDGVGLSDPYLAFKNYKGADLNIDNGIEGDLDTVIDFAWTGGNTFYVSAEGLDDATGDYTLSMMREVSGNIGTNAQIFLGETLTGTIDYEFDRDWYEIDLKAGYTYTFRLSSDVSGTGLEDGWLSLADSTGSTVDLNDEDGDGFDAVLQYTPDEDGTYYISAQDDLDGVGNYAISVDREVANNSDTRSGLVNGETVSDAIDSLDDGNDTDWYAVDLVAGETYTWSLAQDDSETLVFDPVLELVLQLDPEADYDDIDSGFGDYLALDADLETGVDADGNAFATLTYEADADGTYYLLVRDDFDGLGGYDLTMSGDTTESIDGTAGNDDLDGTSGSDAIYGKDGRDTIDGGSGWDYIDAGTGRDTVNGQAGNDRIYAKDGNDTVNGGGDHDLIFGNTGADILNGQAGDDEIDGGKGADEISGGQGDDVIYGKSGHDTMTGNAGDDHLYGNSGQDQLRGGSGADYLAGGQSTDTLYGGDGNDTLHGNNGADTLYGQDDNDTLYGDAGADYLDGGAGDDNLWGGKSTDTFVFSEGQDRIFDFALGVDSLVIDSDLGVDTVVDVLALADDSTADVVIDFGDDNILTLEAIEDASTLADYITFI